MKNYLLAIAIPFIGFVFVEITRSFIFSGAPFLFTLIVVSGIILLMTLLIFPESEGTRKQKIKNEERKLGLHEGEGWVSDDFDDPLPDEFWFGSETDSLNAEN